MESFPFPKNHKAADTFSADLLLQCMTACRNFYKKFLPYSFSL